MGFLECEGSPLQELSEKEELGYNGKEPYNAAPQAKSKGVPCVRLAQHRKNVSEFGE